MHVFTSLSNVISNMGSHIACVIYVLHFPMSRNNDGLFANGYLSNFWKSKNFLTD